MCNYPCIFEKITKLTTVVWLAVCNTIVCIFKSLFPVLILNPHISFPVVM
jgi:hypothetical protein